LKSIIKLALRYLISDRRTTLLLIFAFTFGLTGLITVDFYKSSMAKSLQAKSKNILGADFAILARRALNSDEMTKIQQTLTMNFQSAAGAEFVTMLSASNRSRLAQVRAFSKEGPFYGSFVFLNKGAQQGPDLWKNFPPFGAYISIELSRLMNLNVGDFIKIGEHQFKIQDLLVSEEGSSFRGFQAAPTVLISISDLKNSPLIATGASLTHFLLFKFDLMESQSENLRLQLLEKLQDPQIDVTTPTRASLQTQRLSNYILDYLNIASLISLVISSFGISFLVFYILQKHLKEIAILSALGLTQAQGLLVFLFRIFIPGFIALPLGLILGFVLSQQLSLIMKDISMLAIQPQPQWGHLILISFSGILISILFTLPLLMTILKTDLKQLFSEGKSTDQSLKLNGLWLFPGVIAFVLLSIFLSQSYKIGLSFTLGLVVVLFFIFIFGLILRWLLTRIKSQQWTTRHSLLNIARNPWMMGASYISISLSIVLMSLLSHLQKSISQELQFGSALPSLFLFDIQDEQIDPLKKQLELNRAHLRSLSPLIRARLVSVNKSSFERAPDKVGFQTREDEVNARFRNRGFNLSIRDQLSTAESITQGQWFDGDPNTPEVSIEKEFALRLGVKLGDELQFDVQGVEILTRITSLRVVKWTTFDPNFFALIEPGIIDEAPKTWLASIGSLSDNEKPKIQNQIASGFGNISVIDVSEIVQRMVKMIDSIQKALLGMALLALFMSFFLILISSMTQAETRRKDFVLFNVLGAEPKDLRNLISKEFFIIGLSSAFTGTFLSFLPTFILTTLILKTKFSVDYNIILFTFLILPLLTLLIGLLSLGRASQRNLKNVF